jgi:hypothetical protein
MNWTHSTHETEIRDATGGMERKRKILRRKPRIRWVDNTKIDLRDRFEDGGITELSRDMIQWRAIVNPQVLQKKMNFLNM